MRRKEKEIMERQEIDDIIARSQVCHLALCNEGQAYIVPMNFAYDGQFIYLHSANKGKKIDVLRKNKRVGFAFNLFHGIERAANPCQWGAAFESVIGEGVAEILSKHEDKFNALSCLLKQYGGQFNYPKEKSLASVTVIRISITSLSGKKSDNI